ncbi:hypothetical protein ACHAXA_003959 [Cyclostephanos tholiformis]|uniref:Mitofilin n=1 Tax=Cyclostephanos tholiformis TaxID=382380 RepID=A0ABD3R371_9STRA
MLAGSALLLRRTAQSTARQCHNDQQRRNLTATTPFKRALSKRQLEGGGTAETVVRPPVAPSSGGGSSMRPADVEGSLGGGSGFKGGGGSGGGGILLPLLALAGGGVGAAYYFDAIPWEYLPDATRSTKKGYDEMDAVPAPPKKMVGEGIAREKHLREVVEEVMTKREQDANDSTVVVAPPELPAGEATVPPPTKEDEVAKLVEASKEEHAQWDAAPVTATASSAAVSEGEESIGASDPAPPASDPTPSPATVADALSELRSSPSSSPSTPRVSRTLEAANAAFRADLDGLSEYLDDVDGLSAPQLRARIAQLDAEMRNRTKWEASRLKEFLTMKEKEMEGRYLEILQNQRLEFEDMLARRMREQEDVITRHANAALAAKEEGIQGLMKAANDAREKEIEDVLAKETKVVAEKLELDFQQRLQDELASMKQAHAVELDGYNSKMTILHDKIEALEGRLEVSRAYESGSKRAHRVSAAALALANKLEAGEAAAVELAALEGAAGDDGVIASAVGMIPRSANRGVPTLVDLQATFDENYRIGREAAMVPEGRAGLSGQLLGMLFAKLSVPPSSDAVPKSEEEGNVADGILSLARMYVHLGDLEKAVEQLNRLKGQTAYVMSDWKTKASDRVSTERALKIIKLECALLNKDMVRSES